MKHKYKFLRADYFSYSILFSILFLYSCSKNELLNNNSINNTPNYYSRIGYDIPYKEGTNIILGKKLKNPYTVEIMNLAWQNLAKSGIKPTSTSFVFASHLYVKFKPKNSSEYETLHSDSTLSFSDFPIENEVIQNGDYYHDSSLSKCVPTFQYTSVSIDYKFPEGIDYEIIDRLYIPEIDIKFNYENGGNEDLFVDELLNEAYKLTENFDDTIDISNYNQDVSQRTYSPGGKIRVFDTRLQQWIGMEGVRVQARRWFTSYNGYPDYYGEYHINHSFKRPCNYSIWFGRDKFSVRHNVVNTTFWINGPKMSGTWSYDLINNYQRFAGHVFRGAYRYQAKDIGGLERPWLPNKRQIYVAKDGYKDWSGINWIVLPVIRVARFKTEKGDEYESDEIFSTTCHETGHTSHVLRMNAGAIQFLQVSRQLQESWPIAIEWYLTHIEYSERGILNYGNWDYRPNTPTQYPNNQAYQYWTSNIDADYTSLFINLIDKENDKDLWFFNGTPDDQVFGYTLPLIEQKILKHSYGLSSLGLQLKNYKPYSITDADIDNLLNYY